MIRLATSSLLALVLVVAGCAADDGGQAPPPTLTTTSTSLPDDGFPVTVDAPNGTVTIDRRPSRIVSLSPTSTEVLFAIGAGPQVVAVDSLSNHPGSAPVTDLSAFTPNLEAVVGYDPDLVFISFDPSGDLVPGLEALGIPVIVHGTALDLADAFGQWQQAGLATGNDDGASAAIEGTKAAIESAISEIPEGVTNLTYYYELDPMLYSITSATFIGELIGATGAENIADGSDPDGFGYPQLSNEHIVATDPTLILLADTKCCGQSAETVAARPGWDALTAVSEGTIVELDDDVASRWGPRVVELVEDVVGAILQIEVTDA